MHKHAKFTKFIVQMRNTIIFCVIPRLAEIVLLIPLPVQLATGDRIAFRCECALQQAQHKGVEFRLTCVSDSTQINHGNIKMCTDIRQFTVTTLERLCYRCAVNGGFAPSCDPVATLTTPPRRGHACSASFSRVSCY